MAAAAVGMWAITQAAAGLGLPRNGGDAAPSAGGAVHISIAQLALAVGVLVINAGISAWLRLGLHGKLAMAGVRVVVQVSVLGYVLVPIFRRDAPPLTAAYMVFMLVVAAIESVSRPKLTYPRMLLHTLAALGVPSALMLAYGMVVVVRPHPLWSAQYAVPIAGMLLGNSCSGAAIGLSSVLDDLSSGRDRVEALLAAGASRSEAMLEVVQRAARLALTPTLNQMSVAGIVAIPGLMTGQILAGEDPTVAARYQIVLLILIAVSAGVGAVATIFAAAYTVLDSNHRLCSELLSPKASGKGALAWLFYKLALIWYTVKARSASALARVRLAFGHASKSRHNFFGFQRRRGDVEAPLLQDSSDDERQAARTTPLRN